MRRALALAVLAAGLAAAPAQAAQDVVVVLRGSDGAAAVRGLEQRHGVRAQRRYHAALQGFATTLTGAQRAALRADPAVAAVVDDRQFTGDGQAAIATGEQAPAGIRRTRAATASTAGTPGSAVAVLDTGIDLAHPDLDARHGVNCVSPASPAKDDNGHGTHVAGTIGARNQGAGVVGVAPGTVLYSVKVLNSRKTGTLSQILCGIDWVTANAAALGIRVANLSLSASGTDDGRCGATSRDLQHQAICRSIAAGVTYVATAGNNGRDMATTVPGAYREVLAVTAMNDADGAAGARGTSWACKTTEKDDRAATYSNYAVSAKDAGHVVAGPGTCVVSTRMGGGTTAMTGTSMAAPHVAGVAAACLVDGGACAGLAPAGVITRLRDLAAAAAPGRGFAGDPLAPLNARVYGSLIDAAGV